MTTIRSTLPALRSISARSLTSPAAPARLARTPFAQLQRQRLFARGYAGQADDGGRARDKASVGPFTWKAAAVFVVTGVGLYFYFESEKAKVQERKLGKPQIGGPFALTSHTNETFTEQDLLGKWTLIYFGFTHCPDICPEELDKMGEAVEMIDKERSERVTPIFVSVDPARDPVPQVAKYIKDFHPRMIGLTGDYDAVKRACKSYRVYFSTPPSAQPTDDYLVDHSIFFYLMDPLGQFVDAFGKNTSAQEVAEKTQKAMSKWEAAGGNLKAGVPLQQ